MKIPPPCRELAIKIKKQFSDVRQFFWLLLTFYAFFVFQKCILATCEVKYNVLYECLLTAWVLSPLLLWHNLWLRIWCTSVMTVSIMLHIVTLITGLIYHVNAAPTIWEVIASSSWLEIREFLASFSKITVFASAAGICIVFAGCILLMLMVTRKKYVTSTIRIRRIALHLPFLLCFIPYTITVVWYLSISKPDKIFRKNIVLHYGYEYNFFKTKLDCLAKLNQQPPPYQSVKFQADTSDMLGVIVIGESAIRNHLGCYGYSRDTTPYLSGMKNELLLFDNIISASAVTPDALKYLFTDATLEQKKFSPKSSLVQILYYLNAETYYASNQGRWGHYNLPSVILFDKATEVKFLPVKKDFSDYDEALLPDFLRILNIPTVQKPRFIFLHLMGSHRNFEWRVPKQEIRFKHDFRDNISLQDQSDNFYKELNAYDSTIAYTDKVLGKIIDELKKQKNRPVFFFYVSDHGEFLNAQGVLKRSYQCTVRDAYEIPFVFWFNDEYAARFPTTIQHARNNLHKLAQTDRLLPTLCSAMQITWLDFPENNNLFSPHFVPHDKVYSATGASTEFTDKSGQKVIFEKIKK